MATLQQTASERVRPALAMAQDRDLRQRPAQDWLELSVSLVRVSRPGQVLAGAHHAQLAAPLTLAAAACLGALACRSAGRSLFDVMDVYDAWLWQLAQADEQRAWWDIDDALAELAEAGPLALDVSDRWAVGAWTTRDEGVVLRLATAALAVVAACVQASEPV